YLSHTTGVDLTKIEDTERSNAERSNAEISKVDLQSLPTLGISGPDCGLSFSSRFHNPIEFLAAHLLQNKSQYEDCS
uniref:Uncharacterized protein n=1 Tax=Salmo trutta TaxID=8032 RepID=A0A674BXS5_SALTR